MRMPPPASTPRELKAHHWSHRNERGGLRTLVPPETWVTCLFEDMDDAFSWLTLPGARALRSNLALGLGLRPLNPTPAPPSQTSRTFARWGAMGKRSLPVTKAFDPSVSEP